MLSLPRKCVVVVFVWLGIVSEILAQTVTAIHAGVSKSAVQRDAIRLVESGRPTLSLRVQRPQFKSKISSVAGDVIYVHGSTFGADLSVLYRLDGRSWADEMNSIGLTVWNFDFAGYGESDRYPHGGDRPAGRMDDVIPQLHRVVSAVRARNGDLPIALVAHSWGATVAARYASLYPQDVKALVLFAPIVMRTSDTIPVAAAPQPSHYPLTQWAQYRRFVEDVPRGHPQVLSEIHFQAWATAFLATDPGAGEHIPPSVITPYGPVADIRALWSGQALYDPSLVVAPMLIVRGEWDSLCTDADASHLLSGLGSKDKTDVKIEHATHLMLLESQRGMLHNSANIFLERTMK